LLRAKAAVELVRDAETHRGIVAVSVVGVGELQKVGVRTERQKKNPAAASRRGHPYKAMRYSAYGLNRQSLRLVSAGIAEPAYDSSEIAPGAAARV
jgi:hypothetical protein